MIKKVDHIVITTAKLNDCLDFYTRLGFTVRHSNDRCELYAGDFKINVHILGKELSPHAGNVTVGSADLCFEIDGDIEDYKRRLEKEGLQVELGAVERTGVKGGMKSIYLRDPDENLVEFSSYEY